MASDYLQNNLIFHKKPRVIKKRKSFTTKGNIGLQIELKFSSKEAEIIFDKKTGFINSYTYKNKNLIKQGFELKPNFWRSPTDNDMGANLQVKLRPWKNAIDSIVLKEITYKIDKENKVELQKY